MAIGIGTVIAVAAGGLVAAKVVGGSKKKKRSGASSGLPKPLTDVYKYGDLSIAIWRPSAKKNEYAWALFLDTEPEEVSGSKDKNGRWQSPIAIALLRYTGIAKSRELAKHDAQAQADDLFKLPPPLLVTYEYGGFTVAIWDDPSNATSPVRWALFPGGTIDSVRSSEVAGRWIPPDGLMVTASGRTADQPSAEKAAEDATKQMVGEPASSGGPDSAPAPAGNETPSPPVSETLVVMLPHGADHSLLRRMPGLDEAVASPDCSVVGYGPLFWDRAGNVVEYLLEQGVTSTNGLVNGVLKTFLPDCYRLRASGIDALRDRVVDAVRAAKQELNIPAQTHP